MQRQVSQGVVISCDFCGTDWDQVRPMIEGHHGSVLCLGCLKRALAEAGEEGGTYACTLCLREQLPPTLPRWAPVECTTNANPAAIICHDCMLQAAKTFDKDPDVPWTWQR